MVSPKSIWVQVPWYEILQVLKIPVSSKALPILLTCPLCGQMHMRLFDYAWFGGAWYHCENCQQYGDMIDLASTVMKTTPEAAVMNLSRAGLSLEQDVLNGGEFNSLIQTERGRRVRLQQFWKKAQDYIWASNSLSLHKVKARMGVNIDISSERWKAGPCHLVGAATREEVEMIYHPTLSLDKKDGTKWVLKGRRWGDVIVVPFYDMPGRVSGFGFAGRKCAQQNDFVVRPLTHNRLARTSVDPGLAFLPAVEKSGNGRYVIAVNDWTLGLRLHMKHFRTSISPLPLVAWYSNGKQKTGDAWQSVAHKRVVVWTPRMDAVSLLHAVETDGLLSTTGPRLTGIEQMREYINATVTVDLVQRIIESARPWKEALKTWINRVDDGRVDCLMQSIDTLGGDAAYLMRQCGRRYGTVIPTLNCKKIRTGAALIIEQANSWGYSAQEARHTNRLAWTEVLNCILRITHTVKDQTSGKVYHYGYVRYQNQKAYFLELADVIQDDAFGFIRWLLFERAVGTAVCRSKHQTQIYTYATMFYEPEFVVDDISKWKQKVQEHPVVLD